MLAEIKSQMSNFPAYAQYLSNNNYSTTQPFDDVCSYEQAEITGSEVMGHNQRGFIEPGKQVPSLSGQNLETPLLVWLDKSHFENNAGEFCNSGVR
jgi:hypothetical protein